MPYVIEWDLASAIDDGAAVGGSSDNWKAISSALLKVRRLCLIETPSPLWLHTQSMR